MPVILGLPKGSLQEATFNMMKKAGFNVQAGSRSYVPSVDDPELQCRLIRPQEISRYVELGLLDAGITDIPVLDIDNVNQCRDICSSVDMELGAVVVVMNNTGCVCEVAQRTENAGASTVAGGAVAQTVHQQQNAQNRQQGMKPVRY